MGLLHIYQILVIAFIIINYWAKLFASIRAIFLTIMGIIRFCTVLKRGGAQLRPNSSAVGVAGQRNYSPAEPGFMKFRRKKRKKS